MIRKLAFTAGLMSLALGGVLLARVVPAYAITGPEWQAGRIIDDSIFTDSGSMNVQQIQDFLNQQINSKGGCDTSGSKTASDWGSSLTHAQFATQIKGWPGPPYVCLNEYYEVPKTSPSPAMPDNSYNHYDSASKTLLPVPGGVSAAQLIYNAAQKYHINPKVLLVKIQTESAGPLTQDTWPLSNQYTYAMGADCPDSGPNGSAQCDPNYSGFSMQISEAAELLRYYLDNMNQPWWTHTKPYQNDNVLWHDVGSKDCGSSSVYVQSMGTAALYTYTPYQPNQAALGNLYGTGDSCSSYGNRNFWRQYNDWFGTTLGNLYQAAAVSTNPSVSLAAGQSNMVTVQYRNSGIWTWYDDSAVWPGVPPVRLVTSNAHPSAYSYGWIDNHTPNYTMTVYLADGKTIVPNAHSVAPGQVASFTFPITIPWSYAPGTFSESFQLIMAGTTIDLGPLAASRVTIDVPPLFRATQVSQTDWPTVLPGDSTNLLIRYKNTGQYAWHDSTVNWPGMPPVNLVSGNPNNMSIFSYAWPNRTTAATAFNAVYNSDNSTLSQDQHTANPGQVVEFKVNLAVPWSLGVGNYIEYFKPSLIGAGYSLSAMTGYQVSIPAWNAILAPRSSSSQDPNGYENTSVALMRGGSAWRCVRYQNRGAYTWHDSGISWSGVPAVALATANANNLSIFSYNWSDTSTVKHVATYTFDGVTEADGITPAANPHLVEPNQIARFCFVETTPYGATPGTTYVDSLKPILVNSGVNLVNEPQQNANFNINVPN